MAKLVYLRDIGVLVDQELVDRVPAGFYRRFKMHTCWVTEIYLKHIQRAVKIPIGKINVELTDEGKNPPVHVPGSQFYRWHFRFDEYVDANDDKKKQLLFDAVQTALEWNAIQEGWPVEPFQTACRMAKDDGLVNEGMLDRAWRSPCKRFCVRIHVLHELERIQFSAVLFRSRQSDEVMRSPLGSVVPTGVGIKPFVDDCEWIGPGIFEMRSSTMARQKWQANFGDAMTPD